jgi:hypothetical protein
MGTITRLILWAKNQRRAVCTTERSMVVVLIFLTIAINASGQTTIIVMRNSTEIVAGSDSRSTRPDGSATIACKVSRVGDLYWSVSGFTTDSNYKEVVIAARKPNASIRDTVTNFSKLAPNVFQTGFDQLRLKSPNQYKWVAAIAAKEGITVTFFGMQNLTPVVASVVFFTIENSQGRIEVSLGDVKIHDAPHCSPTNETCGSASGHYELVSAFLENNRFGTDLVPTIRQLIQMEIEAQPGEVGPPIRILKISSAGSQWVQNGNGCNIGKILETK